MNGYEIAACLLAVGILSYTYGFIRGAKAVSRKFGGRP